MGGSDMTEQRLSQTNRGAGKVARCLELTRMLVQSRASSSGSSSIGKSITVLMENDRSKNVINYRLKTDIRDSPTKRLISLKEMHVKDPSSSTSLTVRHGPLSPQARNVPVCSYRSFLHSLEKVANRGQNGHTQNRNCPQHLHVQKPRMLAEKRRLRDFAAQSDRPTRLGKQCAQKLHDKVRVGYESWRKRICSPGEQTDAEDRPVRQRVWAMR